MVYRPLSPHYFLWYTTFRSKTSGAKMLKAIHAQESKKAAWEKANDVVTVCYEVEGSR